MMARTPTTRQVPPQQAITEAAAREAFRDDYGYPRALGMLQGAAGNARDAIACGATPRSALNHLLLSIERLYAASDAAADAARAAADARRAKRAGVG